MKDAASCVFSEGKIQREPRRDLGWYILPRAEQVKVVHLLMLRAIALAKRKRRQDRAAKIIDCLRCDFLPECHMASTAIRNPRRIHT